MTNSYVFFLKYPSTLQIALRVIYVFSLTIAIFFPSYFLEQTKEPFFDPKHYKKNTAATIILLVAITLITAWKIYVRYESGAYRESTIYEYTTILYIVAFYYVGDNKPLKGYLFFLLTVNSLFVFLNGDRGPALQFLLIIYGVYFKTKISKNLLLPFMMFALLILNAIGIWRGVSSFNFSFIKQSYYALFARGLTLDTAYAAEASGMAMVMLTNHYSTSGRLVLLFKYIISIFLGSNMMSSDVDLSTLALEAYPYHGGGGVLPNYGYFYLGMFGVILAGFIVVKYFSLIANTNSESSGYLKCLSLYLLASMMKWYLYSPAPLLRGALLLLIVYKLTGLLGHRMEKK